MSNDSDDLVVDKLLCNLCCLAWIARIVFGIEF
jgi:hypothetical protein